MATVQQILNFEDNFDNCLKAFLGPVFTPLQIPVYTFLSDFPADVPRCEAKFTLGTQIANRGTIFAVAADGTQPQAFDGLLDISVYTMRVENQDPAPLLAIIRRALLPANKNLNKNLAYYEVVALDEVSNKRGPWREGSERCDVSSIVYQIKFTILEQYWALLVAG